MDSMYEYSELHVVSNFTFLRGASHPEEMVRRAAQLGYKAIALTDECSLSGVVRAHTEAKRCGIQFIIGTEVLLEEGLHLILLATDRVSYGKISHFISNGRQNAEKGKYRLHLGDLEILSGQGCVAIWKADEKSIVDHGNDLLQTFPDSLWIGVTLLRDGFDQIRLRRSKYLSNRCNIPRVACGDVHLHHPDRRPLRDTLDAIRYGIGVEELGYRSASNADQHLRPLSHLGRIYPIELLMETMTISDRCDFSLDVLRYEYPNCLVPDEYTAISWLRKLVEEGVSIRWPKGESTAVRKQIEIELRLIEELSYEPYFLTVHDIVKFARQQEILCQGRGSAANSTVCYCLQYNGS